MPPLPSNLANASLPGPVLTVLRTITESGHRAFLVGGCVRDLLRGEPPKDFDVATSARPEAVQRLFKKVIPTGMEHGTVTVVLGGEHVEVTTFRVEAEYVDGRRPSRVDFHEDVVADLSRRDFTINAMAFDPVAGTLEDPFDGQGDLARETVRCVGLAMDRFSEDGLRALRAVRFATVLGFTLDPETAAAIPRTLPIFARVAGERINQELVKLLGSPRAELGLNLLHATGLLGAFFPEARVEDFAAAGAAQRPALQLAVLLRASSEARAVVLRLKFPGKLADEVAHLVRNQALPAADAAGPALRRWLARVGRDQAADVLTLARLLGADTAALQRSIDEQLAANPPLTATALALDGRAMMQLLGVGPSPVIGEAARYLLELVLDDPRRNSAEALKVALLERFGAPR